MITTFFVPWILGHSRQTPEEAAERVKYGKELCPAYYVQGQERLETLGAKATFDDMLGSMVFAARRKDEYLSNLLDCDVYVPGDCVTGIFSLEIVPGLGLGARPSGVTTGGSSVVYVHDRPVHVSVELETIIMGHMAVWRCQRGIVVLKKTKKVLTFNFDQEKWDKILDKLRQWATRHGIPDRNKMHPHLRAAVQAQLLRDLEREEESVELTAEQQAEMDDGWSVVPNRRRAR